MNYIDGYLIPVTAGNKEAYREVASKAAALVKEFGATRIVECWGDMPFDGKRMIYGGFEPLLDL
jgi:uncharacterized protein YbaA (DUF1428 family)